MQKKYQFSIFILTIATSFYFMSRESSPQPAVATKVKVTSPQKIEIKHTSEDGHDHTHHAVQPVKDEREQNADQRVKKLNRPQAKAKQILQASLSSDMQVDLILVDHMKIKNAGRTIAVDKVLVEIVDKNNNLKSSYYALINSQTGKIVRTFSTPIFENKDLIGKNIFYID